jgi:hypothetical protein
MKTSSLQAQTPAGWFFSPENDQLRRAFAL